MSETDSDLDFESADEDAEFASNIKSNIESENCTQVTNELKVARSEGVVKDKTVSEVVGSSDVVREQDDTCKSAIASNEILDEQAPSELKEELNVSTNKIPNDSKEASSINTRKHDTNVLNENDTNVSNEKETDVSNIEETSVINEGETFVSKEEDANINVSKENVKIVSKEKDANINVSKENVKIVSKEKDVNINVTKENVKIVSKEKDANINVTKENVKIVSKEKDITKSHKKEAKICHEDLGTKESHLHTTKTDNEEPECKTDKPRVLLRIEKKKLEKNQLSKETEVQKKPVETKEKASDLVNILREEPPEPPISSWGFSSWGTSLLSTAASSVSTFSNQVSQGIGTVLETVESSLGAPPPEELATVLSQKKKEASSSNLSQEAEIDSPSSLLPDVSSWTKVLENTGSKVLFGGLDTLELIGKKTMDMLTESDPGLRKKRAMFSDKVNVAELLREARAKAEEQDRKDGLQEETIHYSQVFDEKQGLVHLEALEMLSNQSQVKLQRLLMRHSKNVEVKRKLEEIKSICENMPSVDDISDCENFEDFETVFKKHTLELSLTFNIENIMKVQRRINDNISKYEGASEDDQSEAKEIFKDAICSLAEFTAKCIEIFHKVSELIIVQPSLEPDIEHCVTNLTGLTTVMCIEVNNLSTRYHKCLDATAKCNKNKESSEDSNVTTMATNLYVEAANSNKYIQDAYLMLLPVLQVCLLETLN